MKRNKTLNWLAIAAVTFVICIPAQASSHREAPAITERPQIDGTDFYMFRSYEPGREDFVTIIANYNPLQDPFGGPNYFPLDPDARYDIRIDNDGDCREDVIFRFIYSQTSPFISLDVGDAGATETVPIPLSNAGPFGAGDDSFLNVQRTYTVSMVRNGSSSRVRDADSGSSQFEMPFDNIGNKSISDYDAYASQFVHDVEFPGCGGGRLFVGQRKESFAVNLGETFDLVNVTNPLGDAAAEASSTENKNITTLALEVPISCLTDDSSVVAGWTTSSLRRTRVLHDTPGYNNTDFQLGSRVQVSRLANPLVNEVVIGLPDKDRFNSSRPKDDGQFLTYVTHPTLPELLEILFGAAGVQAPNLFPRTDLVQIFLTGVPGLNEDGGGCELMRLNTAIAPTPRNQQSNLGVLGNDLAGYPNGRRPGDDTVDISLRAVMGVLLDPAIAPSGQLPFTDGAAQNAAQFAESFPYLTAPLPGSPNSTP